METFSIFISLTMFLPALRRTSRGLQVEGNLTADCKLGPEGEAGIRPLADLWNISSTHYHSEMMDGDGLLVTWMSVVENSTHPWRTGTSSRPWVMLWLWNWLFPRENLHRHVGNVEKMMGHVSYTPRMTFYHIYLSKKAITGWILVKVLQMSESFINL